MEINLNKQVFDKGKFPIIIDTKFKQLIPPDLIITSSEINIHEFFDAYQKLFFEIPKNGDINSHEYLIKTSSEYVNFDINQEEIIALQAEIAQLRTDLLNTQKQVVELQTGTILANPQ